MPETLRVKHTMDDAIFIEVQQFCRLVHQRGLSDLAVSQPDFSLSLRAMPAGSGLVVAHHLAMPLAAGQTPVTPESVQPKGLTISSPLIGVFYRSPSPDAPPFIEVGDTVETGQTIGIVEAMKVFNEITTDHAGTVISIVAKNGDLVQAEQPLIIIEPFA